MNWEVEHIKKLMGWCPNAQAHEARQHANIENFNSDIPNRARGAGGDTKNLGWLRKASTQTLLVDTFLSLMYLPVLYQLGINLTFLLASFLISLLLIIFTWDSQMQRYETLVKQQVIDHSNMERLFNILKYVIPVMMFSLYIIGREFALQALFSFSGGLLVSMWLNYFQIIYWEKKNHKTIY